MIFRGSYLKVTDNSGISLVKCIGLSKLVSTRKYAKVGDIVLVSVRKIKHSKGIKKGELLLGVIVRVSKGVTRLGGEELFCKDNAVVLLKKNKEPLGTRVLGIVMLEVRNAGYLRIISMAPLTI